MDATYPIIWLQIDCAVAAPVLAISVWIVFFSFFISLWHLFRRATAYLKRLHQVPCSRCAFHTGDYRLKCTVHPCKALTEEAIDCFDYEPATRRVPISLPKFWKRRMGHGASARG